MQPKSTLHWQKDRAGLLFEIVRARAPARNWVFVLSVRARAPASGIRKHSRWRSGSDKDQADARWRSARTKTGIFIPSEPERQRASQLNGTASNGGGGPADLWISFLVAGSAAGNSADNSITLYVDPAFSSLGTGSAPTGGSSASFSGLFNFPFEQVTLENRSGVTSDTMRFDEIRIASSWPLVSPVPEPSVLLLTCCGPTVAVARRRRRQDR